MGKMLFISNVSKGVGSFCLSSLIAAQKIGLDYYYVSNFSGVSRERIAEDEKKYSIKMVNLPIQRSPISLNNYKAYKALVRLIKKENIDYIHCNTPVGGLLGRLAGRKCKVKKIIYEAHGFHFYKGASIINWLIYYPIEKWLAHKTDILITINEEDFNLAKRKMHLRNDGRIEYVPGVGIDTKKYIFDKTKRVSKRIELGLSNDDIALISMGDLIERKNYNTSIKAVSKANNACLKYFICGTGPEEANLKNLAKKYDVDNQVHFLGYRNDVKELLNACDLFLLPSKQEGLARSLMEAMAVGLPCVVSNIRGNNDLLVDEKGGFLCQTYKSAEFAKAINALANDAVLRNDMSIYNKEHIKRYSIDNVVNYLIYIYDCCDEQGEKVNK